MVSIPFSLDLQLTGEISFFPSYQKSRLRQSYIPTILLSGVIFFLFSSLSVLLLEDHGFSWGFSPTSLFSPHALYPVPCSSLLKLRL